jgi:hypothetical protein
MSITPQLLLIIVTEFYSLASTGFVSAYLRLSLTLAFVSLAFGIEYFTAVSKIE